MREFTELVTGVRNLTVTGDANDKLSLLDADSWTLQTSSTQSGYAQYSTTASNETLNIFVADSIKNANAVVIL